jgi:hypothetical protein
LPVRLRGLALELRDHRLGAGFLRLDDFARVLVGVMEERLRP